MATTHYLLNATRVAAGANIPAGAALDEATHDLEAIREAGGVLVLASNAAAATASPLALKSALAGQPPERGTAMMVAAVAAAGGSGGSVDPTYDDVFATADGEPVDVRAFDVEEGAATFVSGRAVATDSTGAWYAKVFSLWVTRAPGGVASASLDAGPTATDGIGIVPAAGEDAGFQYEVSGGTVTLRFGGDATRPLAGRLQAWVDAVALAEPA